MKLVMTLLVRDEQDIIRENIDYHLAQGVDFIIATDNRSIDDTPVILRDYESRGLLRYIFEGNDDFDQHTWVTRMARMSFIDHGADWIINNDADEFWWPIDGNLKDVFARLPRDIHIIVVQRHNFVMTGDSQEKFWRRMVYRDVESLNSLGMRLPPKVAHRGSATINVGQGNHNVIGLENLTTEDEVIEIMHYPIRSYAQFENKIAKGGAAYQRNKKLSRLTGLTWRRLYQDYCADNGLQKYFEDAVFDAQKIEEHLNHGKITPDMRLANFLKRLP